MSDEAATLETCADLLPAITDRIAVLAREPAHDVEWRDHSGDHTSGTDHGYAVHALERHEPRSSRYGLALGKTERSAHHDVSYAGGAGTGRVFSPYQIGLRYHSDRPPGVIDDGRTADPAREQKLFEIL